MIKKNDVIEPSEILMPPLIGDKKEMRELNPWLRFCARIVDYSLFGMIFLLLGHFVSEAFFLKTYQFFIPFLFFLWIPIESVFLHYFGKTPGKFLLGLKVIKPGRKKLDFETALKRSFLVWVRGIALGIPIANIIAMLYAFFQLKTHKISSWDRDENTKITHIKVHPIRIALGVLIIIFYFVLDQFILSQGWIR